MKAQLVEYNDDGKITKRTVLEVYFASSAPHPVICVKLADRQFKHREIYISAKQLIALIMGRIIEKLQ